MSRLADRHLLFGLLALQTGLINQAKLVAAFQAWTLDRSKSLADHLQTRGDLDDADRALIEALAARHLEKHGEIEKGLASITIGRSAFEALKSIDEPDIDATLSHVGRSDPDPDRTGTDHVGSTRSDGPRFRVLRPHARGGLGAVFVAIDSELHREVALKQILEQHADDPRLRGRFLVEAEITGGLEHPGIVPVYGLGNYGNGRPYYAMRFIRGDSLREAIDGFHKGAKSDRERPLKFRQILKRFTDICNAIEYAHSRGVLHRDIKPGNVIVGKHGETLVVDWGLAKPLGESAPDSVERTLMPSSGDGSSETLPGQALGTPAYMSPEQARGDLEKLGPRSDVYSLGATLYYLIAGQAAFQGSVESVLKAVEAGVFPRPRERDGSIDPALEAIVLKAMAKDPADRYGSAHALAEEIDRWLADERVEAYPEPWTRALNRWLTRHRTGVTGIAAAGIVALVGLGIVSAVQTRAKRDLDAKNVELRQANVDLAESNAGLDIQRKRAEANEAEAVDAVKRFKDAIADNPELKNNPELESLRKSLLKEPLSFFGKLRERLQSDHDARPESLVKLAEIIHDYAHLTDEIGDPTDGLKAHDDSLAIWERLVQSEPDRADYQFGLATIENCRGHFLFATGHPAEARAACERAVDVLERLTRDQPAVTQYQATLALSRINLGILLRDVGHPDEARTTYERAIAIHERLARDQPNVTQYQAYLAKGHQSLGIVLRDTGRPNEARAAFEQALAIWEQMVLKQPTVALYQDELADCQIYLGLLLRDSGHPDEARAAYERAIAIRERLVRDHPTVTDYQDELAGDRINLGIVLHETGHSDEARTTYERAIAIQERLARDQPAVTAFLGKWAAGLGKLGVVLHVTGHPDDARSTFERAVAIQERLVRDQPTISGYQAELAAGHLRLGVLLRNTGHPDEARAAYDRAIAIQERLVRDQPSSTQYQAELAGSCSNLGGLLVETGHPDEARTTYERAIAILGRLARDHPEAPDHACLLGGALNNLALIDGAASRFAEAREKLLEAISWQKRALAANPNHPQYRRFYQNHLTALTLVERELGHGDEAVRLERELADFRRIDPQFEALDARLKAVLNGEDPRDDAERLALAQRAYDTRRFAAAAKLWGEALDSDPGLAVNRQTQHPYNAACAAALASDGQGEGPPGDDDEKARLRGRVLAWLQAEREIWSKLLESGPPRVRPAVVQTLHHWLNDTDLASVRDPEPLARLSEEERAAWRALWEAVAALLQRAQAP